jgi:hypothetical protein
VAAPVVSAGPVGSLPLIGRRSGLPAEGNAPQAHSVEVVRSATWAADARQGNSASAVRRADHLVSSGRSRAAGVAAVASLEVLEVAVAGVAVAPEVAGGVRRYRW